MWIASLHNFMHLHQNFEEMQDVSSMKCEMEWAFWAIVIQCRIAKEGPLYMHARLPITKVYVNFWP